MQLPEVPRERADRSTDRGAHPQDPGLGQTPVGYERGNLGRSPREGIRSELGGDVGSEFGECGFCERAGVVDASAVGAVLVTVPDDQELERDLVDPVVVLGFQPVGLRLPILAQQDQRRA